MAEAFLRKYAGDYFDVHSAGYDPKPINPLTIKVMAEIGYDLSGQHAKDLWQLTRNHFFGIAISVCKRNEEEGCPTIMGTLTRLYWNIDDPSAFVGSEEEKLAKFREVRDIIDSLVRSFLKDRKITIEREDAD